MTRSSTRIPSISPHPFGRRRDVLIFHAWHGFSGRMIMDDHNRCRDQIQRRAKHICRPLGLLVQQNTRPGTRFGAGSKTQLTLATTERRVDIG
jgi:hypothetical protein